MDGSVVAVGGRAGWYLDQVVLTLRSGEQLAYPEPGVASGDERPDVTLDAEHLVAVEQYAHDGSLGAGLRFTTSAGRAIEVVGSKADRSEVCRHDAGAEPVVADVAAAREEPQRPRRTRCLGRAVVAKEKGSSVGKPLLWNNRASCSETSTCCPSPV